MKKEIKIGSFFRGSEKYGEELIKAIEDAGGDNFLKYTGRDEDVIYYLEEGGHISLTDSEVLQHLFLEKIPENEITIDDLREDEDMTARNSRASSRSCPAFLSHHSSHPKTVRNTPTSSPRNR